MSRFFLNGSIKGKQKQGMTNNNRNTRAFFEKVTGFVKKQEVTTGPDEKQNLWTKIEREIVSRERVRKLRIYASVATAAVLLGFAIWIESAGILEKSKSLNQVVSEISVPKQASDIILMVSDSDEIRIEKDTAIVNFADNGKITVNNEAIETKPTKSSAREKEEKYNQIIVPGGKRTMLTLSDSTKIWVNAGTRIIFPEEFKGTERRIFVDGEAYLEVTENKRKPFVVETPAHFEIEVLGTAFNVCTYDELEFATVVLARGKVEVTGSGRQKKIMAPDQLLKIDAEGVLEEPIPVNAEDYISWTKGLMVIKSKPFSEVLKRLQIYFGVPLNIDPSLNESISGQLALKDDFEEVLLGLKNIVSFSYHEEEEGGYRIEKD
ncbi:FecR family protein [Sunxiuqinia elliptica]|uniref:FecR family protein n=1 Tax=Sunxiuqinia elliptica TaxID=655355 RepID=A0A4R6GPC5_9BACT|nr:FecR domain-containing protein [Sunxiuqinia elliptica]TDN97122.1 FecR family protein [Sunxiuqinia elliptica]TDO60693.1 FecR family protein [Sunxiuqinia elliptica]